MKRVLALSLAALAAALASAAPAAALTPTITSFPSSAPVSSESHPYAIAAGADGALWFTDPYAHKIGRITVSGLLTLQAPVPPSSFQYDIAAGSDGAMWFVSQGPSAVSRIDAAGNVLTKALGNATANPTEIISGPDGALWFNEAVAKVIARIPATTPLASPDESRLTNEGTSGLTVGPDGNLWFSEYGASEVGRMTLGGSTKYFPLPAGVLNPEAITAGPDGALWVTTLNPATVVRMTVNGAAVVYPVPVTPFPGEIVTGPDGALWFTASDNVVRMATDGSFQAFPLPAGVGLLDIAAGPDGNLWFTEANAGLIGRITTPPNATTGAAQSIGAKRAVVAGSVSGHSQATEARVEYGPQGAATATTAAVGLPASAAAQPVSIALEGLRPGTAYRYRVLATNGTGPASGAFASFTTAPAPRCRVARVKHRTGGRLALRLSCSATSRVVARATARAHGKRVPYARAAAVVREGKASLLLEPGKRARAQLRLRHRLQVKLAVKAFGGDTVTTVRKKLVVKTAGGSRGSRRP